MLTKHDPIRFTLKKLRGMFFKDFFSSDELQFVKYIFKVPRVLRTHEISKTVEFFIPKEDIQVLDSIFSKPSTIIRGLSLSYEVRVPLIDVILKNFENELSGEEFDFYSLIVIQSSTFLFFKPLKEIDPKLFFKIFSCLNISFKSEKIAQDKKIQLISLILNRIDDCSIIDYLPAITKIFMNHSFLVDSCVPQCFEITKKVFESFSKRMTAEDQMRIALFIMQYSTHLKSFVGKRDMYQSIQIVMNVLSNEAANENQFEISLISLLVNLMSFAPNINILFDTIDIFSQRPKIFRFCENNETNEFEDIPKTPVMVFHNVPDNDEKIEPIMFKTFTQVQRIFSHPLISMAGIIISNESFNSEAIYYRMIQEALKRLSQGKLHYTVILYIFFSQKLVSQHGLTNFLEKENLWEKIINPVLYVTNENVFETPDSDIIIIRKTSYELVSMILDSTSSVLNARRALLSLLRMHTQDSLIFSEILAMTYKMLNSLYDCTDCDDDLFDILFEGAVVQQHRHILGSKLSGKYRSLTFSIINELLHSRNAVEMVQKSAFACSALCASLFECSYFSTCVSSLRMVLTHLNDDIPMTNVTNALHQMFLGLLPFVTKPNGYNMLFGVSTLLEKILKEKSVCISNIIINSPVLSDIFACVIKITPTAETKELFDIILSSLYTLQYSSDFDPKIVPYAALGTQLNAIGIDDKTYKLIIRNISCATDVFNRISQPDALQLLLFAVKGTERYKEILKIILELCENSICNRCSCLVGGLVTFIFDYYDDSTYELTLQIFEVISETICSKSSLFAFIRHFSKFEAGSMNKRLLSALSCLARILNKAKNPDHYGLIQLTSPLSCIQIPSYKGSEIIRGMVVDFEVLFDNFTGERTLIELGTGTLRFVISLMNNRIRVSAIDGLGEQQENQLGIRFPVNRFFRFTMYIVINSFVSFFIDDQFVKGVPALALNIDESANFDCNLVFKCMGANSTQLQIKKFLIKTVETVSKDMSEIPKNCNTKMSVFFSANSTSKGKLLMKTDKGDKLVDVRGICIPFYSNFMKIFEASHTIEFITSIFGSSNTPDALKSNLFNTLIQIYATLVAKSPTVTQQIIDFNGFSIVSYFLDDLPAEYISEDVWKVFVVINSLIEYDQKQQLCTSIICNFEIWKKASLSVQLVVINDIFSLSADSPTLLLNYLNVQTIVKYLTGIVDCGNKELIDRTIELLGEAAELTFDEPEQRCIFLFVYSCQDDAIGSKILRRISKLNVKLKTNMEWCSLFFHKSESIIVEWLDIFLNDKREKIEQRVCLFSLISNTTSVLTDKDDPKQSFITRCMNKALGTEKETTLEEISKYGGKIVNFLPILFALAQITSTPPSIVALLNKCFIRLLKEKSNINFISSQLDNFSLIIVVFYLLTKGRCCINSMGAILLKHNHLSATLGIIDSIQSLTNIDFSEQRLAVLESAFEAIAQAKIENLIDFYDLMVMSVLFHYKVTTTKSLEQAFADQDVFDASYTKKDPSFNTTLLFRIVLFFTTSEAKNPTYSFSLAFKDGVWMEEIFARKVLFAALSNCTMNNSLIPESIYFLLYAFIRISIGKFNLNSLAPILAEVFSKTDKEDPKLSIVLYLLRSYEGEEISCVYSLIEKNKNEMKNDRVNYEANKQLLNFATNKKPSWIVDAYQNLRETFKILIDKHTHFLVPQSSDVTYLLDKIIARDAVQFNRRQAEHNWRRLWQSMSLTHNPFLTTNGTTHYKRGNVIGSDFCPLLLKKNTDFTIHADASKNCVDDSLFLEKIPSHFDFKYETRELKPVTFNKKLLKWRAPCDMIKVQVTTKGEFNVFSDSFTFISDDDSKSTKIMFDDVKYIFLMNVVQRPTAIEIFTHSHRSYFFNFPSLTERQPILKNILNNSFPNAEFIQTKAGAQEVESLQLTHKWQTHQISTFTYLMWLNQLSGRSFNNTQNYPVFPWILSDYTSNRLNLDNPNVFRDLSKPVGALNEERLQKIKLNILPDEDGVPILYRSTYSCPFHVYYFLLRLEPYTTLHIEIQDGHFDVPSRLFATMASAWGSAAGLMNNFKELVPEFFFLPDFLQNKDEFKLGTLPSGETVGDVILPPWASTAEEFIQLHRKALECEYTGQHINQWIDLIWGVNQTGEGAINNDNVFDQRLYENVWENHQDPEERPEIESMLKHVGVIPNKLFNLPHPKRNPLEQKKISFQQFSLPENCVDMNVSNGNVYLLYSDSSVFVFNKSNQLVNISKVTGDMSVHCPIKNGLFAYISSDSRIMSIISQNGKVAQQENTQHIENITCITSCGSYIFTGGKDGVFAEWSTQRSVMSHSESIVCSCSCEEQNVAVSCGVDGMMIVMTANPLKFVHAINMNLPEGTVPQCVSIGSNGIIAVVSGHQSASIRGEIVSLFTVNGSKFAEEKIGVTAISVIVLNNGSVYIAAATHEHVVMLYNGATLKLKEFVVRCDSQVTSLNFDQSKQNLYIMTKNGTLTVCNMFIK